MSVVQQYLPRGHYCFFLISLHKKHLNNEYKLVYTNTDHLRDIDFIIERADREEVVHDVAEPGESNQLKHQ